MTDEPDRSLFGLGLAVTAVTALAAVFFLATGATVTGSTMVLLIVNGLLLVAIGRSPDPGGVRGSPPGGSAPEE